MAYTVKIEYAAVAADVTNLVSPICRLFAPTGCYTDTKAYEGSVYDTNVDGWGEALSLEKFIELSIDHPGALMMFKKAALSGTAVEFETDDYKDATYYEEVGKALKDQGFTVTVTKKA